MAVLFRIWRWGQAARPQPVGPDHVDLDGVQGELGLQVEPGDQAEYQGERAVQRRGVGQLMRDEITAEGLQYLPDDGADGRAGPQLPPGDLARGADPEAEPEQPEVQHQRYRVEQHGLAGTWQDTAGAGRDTGNDRGADEAHPDH